MTTLPSSEKLARIIFDAEKSVGLAVGSFEKASDKERMNRLSIANDVLAAIYKLLPKKHGKK